MSGTPTFEPEAVISAAKHQIISSNYKEVDQARSTVFSILEKCDELTSIALYLQFADLEIELRQFKQATKVLEQAVVTRPLSLALWKRYVGFCLERQKHSNAKKLVVRAIELLPTENHAELWGLLEQNEHTKGDVEVLKAQVAAGATLLAPTPPVVAPASAPPTSTAGAVAPAAARSTPSIEPLEHKTAQYFDKLPLTLPVTPDCPHLLFDPIDSSVQLSSNVLYQLEDFTRNERVFGEVLRLYESQRQKEVDTLYRWQDLIAMQMKEGSELYRRHHSSGANSAESENLIQRHEFTLRAASSQAQFIEITAMDRSNQLVAQQRALEALRVPTMSVSKDPNLVTQQRRVILWLLEAERAWSQSQQQPRTRTAVDPRDLRRSSPRPADELFHPYASRGRPPMQRPMGGGRGRGGRR
ncbi:hypothetical protein H310_13392 [Aphanomyces invadans]|uniref:Uncharacterized protein n=1 Tax=Aphanomyces invadans TaxID=157072 RepID=A0A024TDK2_9STRA|nr:hypothetical protein H310_13392 [Aphanomyces invadans]ETV92138.1 hypothetical protein H310_13392 [Aphanomyces invadans]|eukprot:XP_008879102.1 hypothetical protein H310_13392 [Aphanomyces invadans]